MPGTCDVTTKYLPCPPCPPPWMDQMDFWKFVQNFTAVLVNLTIKWCNIEPLITFNTTVLQPYTVSSTSSNIDFDSNTTKGRVDDNTKNLLTGHWVGIGFGIAIGVAVLVTLVTLAVMYVVVLLQGSLKLLSKLGLVSLIYIIKKQTNTFLFHYHEIRQASHLLFLYIHYSKANCYFSISSPRKLITKFENLSKNGNKENVIDIKLQQSS